MKQLNGRRGRQKVFYGWHIVAVGFLANVGSAFALASTLSIFLKPLTADLGISRGVFSLLRSGEAVIGATIAPFVGTVADRHGGRWLIALGTAIVAVQRDDRVPGSVHPGNARLLGGQQRAAGGSVTIAC